MAIKKYIKERLTSLVRTMDVRLNPSKFRSGDYFCPVCSTHVQYFNPVKDQNLALLEQNEFIHPLFRLETFNLFKYTCPSCGATDRDRLYALYLLKNPSNQTIDALEIAPSPPLSAFIKSLGHIKYRTADLYKENVDDKVDITNMQIYANNSFDFILCSHVLEHVIDDKKAMRELFRVLRMGGKGIVMVPIMLSLDDDYEDPSITTESGRWRHFGQGDHVRMYSKAGFKRKLITAGFSVNELDNAYFDNTFARHGISEKSVLYVVSKN